MNTVLPKQSKYNTELEARAAAREYLKFIPCQIVKSKENGIVEGRNDPWIYYLEYGEVLDMSFIRNWERLVYSGKGNKA